MWQPNAVQWRLIWTVAVLVILAWPEENRSLGVKVINWAADPFQSLPRTPTPLAIGRGDNVDAVIEHDSEEQAYYHMYNESWFARARFYLRDLRDPFDPATERQVLVGLAILTALGIWRTETRAT